MSQQKLLTLCMITYNDEKYIWDSIKNMKDIVDEILIVDIGSNDKTIEIAKTAGANVHQIKWENDFSKVKNFCLDNSNGQWILFLQPNEIISNEKKLEIKGLLGNPNVEGYLFYINYNSQIYSVFSPVQTLRLLRNRKEYRYKYKSFEMIPDDLLNNIKDVNIQIVYRYDVALSWDFNAKIQLLYNEIVEVPQDPYLQYMLGIVLINQNKFKDCVLCFQKACDNLNVEYLYAPHLYKCLSFSLLYLEKYDECLKTLNNGIDKFPFYRDLFVLRGVLFSQLKQYKNSIIDFEQSLKMKERSEYIVPGPDINVIDILESAGEVYEKVFCYQKALKCYQESYALNDTNYDLFNKIVCLAYKIKDNEMLQQMLESSIEHKNINGLIIIINFLFRHQKYRTILDNINKIEKLFDNNEQFQYIKIVCYIMLDEYKENLKNINIKDTYYNSILLKRIEKSWFKNAWEESSKLLSEMNQIPKINDSLKNLYIKINESLINKKILKISLSQEQYEIVKNIHNNFLWYEQEDKAKLLLYTLLKYNNDENYIELAQIWSLYNDVNVILEILLMVSQEKQEKFKTNIIETLLINQQSEKAKKLLNIWDDEYLQQFKEIIFCNEKINKLNYCVNEFQLKDTYIDILNKSANKIDDTLLEFYDNLCITFKMNNCFENSEVIDVSEVYKKIAEYYKKTNKKIEMLSALFSSLKWNPINKIVQDKIILIYNKNPKLINLYLKQEEWYSEGFYFDEKYEFINYLLGVINFKNKKIDQSLLYFKKINKYSNAYVVSFAYICAIQWLSGEKDNIFFFDKKDVNEKRYVLMLYNICKDYLVDILNQNIEKYPYNQLIQFEKEKIYNKSKVLTKYK